MTQSRRTCELCGAEYEATDTALRCSALQGGTYCGGTILPGPTVDKPAYKCPLCKDAGRIYIEQPLIPGPRPATPQRAADHIINCPRGCSPAIKGKT